MQRTSNTTRIPKAKLGPMALRLREKGWTVPMIAKQLSRSERYVYELLKYAKQTGDSIMKGQPDPKEIGSLDQELQDLLEYTPDAFEAFFNRYSGRTLSPIHKEWVTKALTSQNRRVLINCPPRHAKSTIFSVWMPIWLVTADRDVQILIISQTEKLAKKFTNEISYNLSYNQDLIEDFGRYRPELGDWPWRPNSGELLVEGRRRQVKSGDLTIQVRGTTQQILGMEANWVICDDPVSREISRSPTEREKLSEAFHGDVMSRLEPSGTAVVIGQRMHLHDLYGELSLETATYDGSEPKLRWQHLNYPAIRDWEAKEVLWPERWPFHELMDKKADLGNDLFEAMYQQNPLPSGERLALDNWINGSDEHVGCLDLIRGSLDLPEGLKSPVRVVSLDPSPTRYAGLIVGDLEWNRTQFDFHVIEIRREKMTVRDMLMHIRRCVDWYNPRYLVVEQNAAQRWLLQDPVMEEIKRKVKVIPHTTNRNKADPTLGVMSLAVDFEYGRIHLPYGDPEAKEMSKLLIDEATTYPHSKTDDLLMALWFVKFNYQRLVPFSAQGISTGGWMQKVPPRLKGGWSWTKQPSTYKAVAPSR